jgi:hypothetical protein
VKTKFIFIGRLRGTRVAVIMSRRYRMSLLLFITLGAHHSLSGAADFSVPITNLSPVSDGSHVSGDFDFGGSFSRVESLEIEFVMPNGYQGSAPTVDNAYARSLYFVIHAASDRIQFTASGLGFPLASSLFTNFYQVRPGVPAGFQFQSLTLPSAPPGLQRTFREFTNSGRGRVTLVDVELRHPDAPFGASVASYALPGEITQARITITGTPVPEPRPLLMFFVGSGAIAAGRHLSVRRHNAGRGDLSARWDFF